MVIVILFALVQIILMKKFDVHVIDDALDKDSNVAVCRSAVEHDGKWAPPIDFGTLLEVLNHYHVHT